MSLSKKATFDKPFTWWKIYPLDWVKLIVFVVKYHVVRVNSEKPSKKELFWQQIWKSLIRKASFGCLLPCKTRWPGGHMSCGQMCRHQMLAKNFLSQKTLTKLKFFLTSDLHLPSNFLGGPMGQKFSKSISPNKIEIFFTSDLHLPSNFLDWGVLLAKNFLIPKTLTKLNFFLL